MSKQVIVSVLGITCTGKDTLVERIQQMYPDTVGLIQVGKEMRRRHPPEYFKGQGALQDTEPETWEIFDEQHRANDDKNIILVVGIPRLKGQISRLLERFDETQMEFIQLHCDEKIVQERLQNRFKDKDDWKALAWARLQNDKIQQYEVLVEIILHGFLIEGIDISSYHNKNFDAFCTQLVERYL